MSTPHPAEGTALETPAQLLAAVDSLRDAVQAEGEAILERWPAPIERPSFAAGAANLALYLALRHRDLRSLQTALMRFGLSSLGRLESRVLPTLDSVAAALAAITGQPLRPFPGADPFFAGERQLAREVEAIFGPESASGRHVRILVTCPSEAADQPDLFRELLEAGADAVRINCAHDDAAAWTRMVEHLRAAERAIGRSARVLMDLGGPKCRILDSRHPAERKRIVVGDRLRLVAPGAFAVEADPAFQAECAIPEALGRVRPGDRVLIDDGKLGGTIETVSEAGVVLTLHHAPSGGARLKPEKGLNFPDTDLGLSPLTAKDLRDLDTVVRLADLVGFSFVQGAGDIQRLQEELARRRPGDWQQLGLVAKIETPRAVLGLPGIVVEAASRQPFAVMIARGDLAVELGFERLAEMQEEIMWLAEAAHVPVIWATQVLESLVKKGLPSRGDMTDAAMSARAECVMLNKGPHVVEAVRTLDRLLGRMAEHQSKKTPKLRRLRSW